MGLKKTEEEKKAAAEQRKKNRQGLAKFAGKVWKGVKYHATTPHAQVKRDRAQKKEDLKIKDKVKKDTKSPAAKAGLSVEQRAAAAKRTATFKADRKVKDKGQKSYNKGKDKKDWVNSAYERRQKDAETATKKVAKKRHETFKADRKVKDKGQKSYNKGRDKKDHVGSAYERRQADSKKEMQDSARKRHEAWKKARADKKAAKNKNKETKKNTKARVKRVTSDKFLRNIK